MSAPDKQPTKPAAESVEKGQGSLGSLTRTLEDLEARLSRLSGARREIAAEPAAEKDETSDPSTSARLRAIIERRLSGSSRLAMDALDDAEEQPAAKRARPAGALDRRFGTIAGEVETLKMQGQTLQLVSGVAEELQALKSEITEKIAARSQSGFSEIRSSFEELREAISTRDEDGVVSGQIVAILQRLSEMQESGVDKRSLDILRAELDGVSRLVSDLAREDSVAAVGRRWDEFEARLEAHIELDGAAKRDLRAELERLRDTVRSLATEEQVRAVESRWDAFEAHYFEKLRVETEDQLGRFMRGELDALRARIDALAAASSGAELGERLDRIEKGGSAAQAQAEEAIGRLATRFGELEEALFSLPGLLGVERLEQRIQALAETVALVSEQQHEPDLDHFVILEERLDEISQAIVASALKEEASFDMAPVERIEARVADLSTRLERLSAEVDPERLSARIAELSSRIEELAAKPHAEIEERLHAFSLRIEVALEQFEKPQAETAIFEERLTALAGRLEEAASNRVDEDVVRSLETQIARLAAQLSEGQPALFAETDAETARRLEAIEQRLEENRAEVMTAARTAADEAVRLMLKEGARREGEHVRNLSDDLRALESLCRENDDRSFQVFEAVHSTLMKIADRLTTIEGEVRRSEEATSGKEAASAPILSAAPPAFADFERMVPQPDADTPVFEGDLSEAPAPRGLRAAITRHLSGRRKGERTASEALADAIGETQIRELPEPAARADLADAPSIDAAESILSREVNRPLEPGSGAPDIASLLERVRLQQSGSEDAGEPVAKADFIAAARKAALAAAAEADSLRRESEGGGESIADISPKNRFGRHRKPILMAVGAVLLAMMAMPLGRAYLERDGAEIVEMAENRPGAVTSAASPVEPVLESSLADIPQAPVAATEPERAEVPVEPSRLATAVPPAPAGESVAALAAARAANGDIDIDTSIHTASLSSQPAVRGSEPEVLEPADAEVAIADMARETENPILSRALAKLPDEARTELPRPPSAIGPTALVAASDAGDPKAIFEIGLRLMEGRTGESKPDEALRWFAEAGRLGYAPAQYSLGTLFEKGNGVSRDTGAARDWYLLAAEEGNVRAMHNLAVLYATGIEGRSEPETAARWFTEAAEYGMRDSQYNLGILHARGAGVDQDFARSYKWFSIVGAAGDRDAAAKRDEVAKTLSADQIAELDAEIASWTPRPRNDAANAVDIPPAWEGAVEETASIDKPRAIRNVQAILLKLGFDPGTPDGIVGARTTEAVRAFQEKNGLDTTGEIDEALIRELLKRNV